MLILSYYKNIWYTKVPIVYCKKKFLNKYGKLKYYYVLDWKIDLIWIDNLTISNFVPEKSFKVTL